MASAHSLSHRFERIEKKTKRYNWPLKVNPEDPTDKDVETEFYEGAFVNMLLNKVSTPILTVVLSHGIGCGTADMASFSDKPNS